jgi:hypothetical protein
VTSKAKKQETRNASRASRHLIDPSLRGALRGYLLI